MITTEVMIAEAPLDDAPAGPAGSGMGRMDYGSKAVRPFDEVLVSARSKETPDLRPRSEAAKTGRVATMKSR